MVDKTVQPAAKLRIYFAGAIRGGRSDAGLYARLIDFLGSYGTVLTSHVGNDLLLQQEQSMSEKQIFERDMKWLEEADCFIAEVSTPSLGVGYEISLALTLGKKILCLYRPEKNRRLSAMISGNPMLQLYCYYNVDDAELFMHKWLRER